MAAASSNLAQLTTMKLQKLEEQKKLADEMNGILRKHLIEESKLATKNLKAAIAASKSPGFFEYHQSSEEVKKMESEKVMATYSRSISKVHNEIVGINNEIALATSSSPGGKQAPNEVSMSSFNQWFDTYGRPKDNDGKKDMFSNFAPAPKIYGGTSHHRSFKSSASIMTKGKMTR
jgi:hypothetical protein